jgi:hypothetical protein
MFFCSITAWQSTGAKMLIKQIEAAILSEDSPSRDCWPGVYSTSRPNYSARPAATRDLRRSIMKEESEGAR